jgi:hypothetical protein
VSEPTRTIQQFDATAALHVLRRWAIEQVEAHWGVTVLTSEHVLVTVYPEYGLGVADENWVEFHSGTSGQWERKCHVSTARRHVEEAIAVVVPTEVVARSTR